MSNAKSKELNKLEDKLNKELSHLFLDKKVKFTYFLDVLNPDITNVSTDDYRKIHKVEYIKLIRATFSFDEVKAMLGKLDIDIVFKCNNKVITPTRKLLEKFYRIKYTQVMEMCDYLGLSLEWVEKKQK